MTEPAPATETPKLKPANENPWYILMTLHGEQPQPYRDVGTYVSNFDPNLHAKNRRDWNRWASKKITANQRLQLLKLKDTEGKPRFNSDELTPHNENEVADLISKFNNVSKFRGRCFPFPPSNMSCSMIGTEFSAPFCASGFLFPGVVELTGSIFLEETDLSNSVFTLPVHADETKFYRDIIFYNTTFFHSISFADSIVYGQFLFSHSAINQYIIAVRCIFHKNFDFSDVIFNGWISFVNCTIKGQCSFRNSIFMNESYFVNTSFHYSTSFANAAFQKFPPNFHEAVLHSDTDWFGAQWPSPPKVIEEANQHVRHYQRLKQIMEGLKKHEDELNFFAMEMKAQRVVDGKWSLRWMLNGLYGALSDYGRSVFLPSFYLVLFTLASFAFLTVSTECRIVLGMAHSCTAITEGKALGLSLTSALGFLPLKKEIFTDLSGLSSAAHLIMAFETLVSFALLFLIGLGLRNRFRMK